MDDLLTERLRRLYVIIERSDGIHLVGGAGKQTGRVQGRGGLVQRRGENPETDLECFPLIFELWRRELFAPTPVSGWVEVEGEEG